MGAHPAAEIIHCICVAGQDGADLDLVFVSFGLPGGGGELVVDVQHRATLRGRRLARELELERQRAGGGRRG